jgi:hypothetical protein
MIPGSINALLLGEEAGGAAAYSISRSLRFNSSDSAFLSRNFPSAGNRRTFTFSFWIKRTILGTSNPRVFGIDGSGGTDQFSVMFDSTNALYIYGNSTGTSIGLTSTGVFRDASAWYHIVLAVDTTQATAANRFKAYVNGSSVAGSYAYPSQNDQLFWNNADTHYIGRYASGYYTDDYLADIHFIDGQALTPSSFAETNATTGQWVPKAYTGTYGTNGFRLDFSDNSAATATTLGKDRAGSNNWTPNNLSVTAGVGNDSLVDTPTSYGTDTGAGGEVMGNYCTWNPLEKDATTVLSNGNLEAASIPNGAWLGATLAVRSGKWYYEITTVTGQYLMLGVADYDVAINSKKEYTNTGTYYYYGSSGQLRVNGVNTAFPDSITYTYANNDVIGIAFDCDAGTVNFYRNGAKVGGSSSSITGLSGKLLGPALSAGSGGQSCSANFGQRAFAYTAPSGFKALCDTNLPAPVVAKPSSAFDCVTYTGTGATLTPTSSLGFSPDLVWIKSRSAATDHTIYDAVRGTQARLESNNTDPEVTSDGGLTAFNSNGFTLGTLAQVNTNAATYVAWCWDEAVADGFDIVTYTGNGANRTIAHSLGVAPSFMIVKQRTAASATNWAVWHSSLANTEYLLLNSTAAKATGATYWNSTSPTSTNFSLGTAADVNTNNGTYVAYLWSSVVGYSSGFSYTGNGSTDGSFVYLGFRPRLILLKCSSTTGNWTLLDTAREGYNVDNDPLYPNLSDAEGTTDLLDITSNGFKLRTTNASVNSSGATYVGYAWAEAPFAYSRAR